MTDTTRTETPLSAPTFRDAAARVPVAVRRPGHEPVTARLFFLPGGDHRRRVAGTKARVVLPSGAVLSVPVESIDVVSEETS